MPEKRNFERSNLSTAGKQPVSEQNSVEELLSFIAEKYCCARNRGKKEKRRLSGRIISDTQYQLYRQRDQVNFAHFHIARHWDDYQCEQKRYAVDAKTDNSDFAGTKHERLRKDPLAGLGVTESSECLRGPLFQEDVTHFSAVVEVYYTNRRMIEKGQRYEKGKYFDVKLEMLLRLVLDTDTFGVTIEDKNLYPIPVIVYAVLSSPKTLRNVSPELKTILGMSDSGLDGNSETQFFRKPIGEYSYDETA